MLDLPTLGRELRAARRALRIPSAELARRIGVSQTYVWLIEEAKPRKSGEPSRPGEALLQRWTSALGMSETQSRRIGELAGYFDSDALREHRESRMSAPLAMRPAAAPAFEVPAENDDMGDTFERDSPSPPPSPASPMRALHHWAGTERPGMDEEAITDRIHDILQGAERNGRVNEAAYLLDSLLHWLEFHVKERR